MKKTNDIHGFRELTSGESRSINGGETLWYWATYAIGNGVRFIKGFLENPPNLPSATQYK